MFIVISLGAGSRGFIISVILLSVFVGDVIVILCN